MQLNKRTLKAAGIVVGAVLVIMIALPLFININSFRPKIESQLTSALGRSVTLGEMSLSLFSGKVSVENVSIADDAAFSKSPFITMKSLEVSVEVMPLIFSKQLTITGIELGGPRLLCSKVPAGPGTFLALAEQTKTTLLSRRSRVDPRTSRSLSWRSKMAGCQSGKPTPRRSRRFSTS